MSRNKLQCQLITYLNKFGSIEFILPDGVGLQISITQESKHGEIKSDDYCYVSATRENRCTSLDRYSMSMAYELNDLSVIDEEGCSVFIA